MRRLMLALATIALLVPPSAAAQAPEPQTSLPDIEDEVMCVVCGVTLELATEAPQAIQEREFIRGLGMPADVEARLLALTPATYTGLAADLVRHLDQD